MYTNYDQSNNMLAMPNYGMASQYVNEPQPPEDDGLDALELTVIFSRVGQLFALFAGGSTIAYTFPVTGTLITVIGCGISLFLIGLALKTKGDQSWLLGLAMAAIVLGTANGMWGAISIFLVSHGFKLAVVAAVFVGVIVIERMSAISKQKQKAQQRQQSPIFMPLMSYGQDVL
jgi:hypothetical protein